MQANYCYCVAVIHVHVDNLGKVFAAVAINTLYRQPINKTITFEGVQVNFIVSNFAFQLSHDFLCTVTVVIPSVKSNLQN